MTHRQKNSDGPIGSVRSVFWARHNWSSAPINTRKSTWGEQRRRAKELKADCEMEVSCICSTDPALRAKGETLLQSFPIDAPSLLPEWQKQFESWRQRSLEEHRRQRVAKVIARLKQQAGDVS
jgi:hypothetical protein